MSKYRVDIQTELNNIKTTPYGRIMRPNIHDGLEKLARKQNALSDTFNNLIVNGGNSPAEVVESRNDVVSVPNVNYPTLGDRLNAMQQQLNNVNPDEVVNARQDANGNVKGSLKQRLDDDFNYLDDKFDGYLPLTGGSLTGDVRTNSDLIFDNNKGIVCKTIRGVEKYILYMSNLDKVILGHEDNQTVIRSVDVPVWLDENGDSWELLTKKGGTIQGTLTFRDAQGNTIEFKAENGQVVVDGGDLNLSNRSITNANSISFANAYITNRLNGIGIGSNNSGRSLTIDIDSTKADFRTDSNQFYFHGKLETNGDITPLNANWYNVGTTNKPFYQMHAQAGMNQTSDRKAKEDIKFVEDEEFFKMIKGTQVRSYLYKLPESQTMTTSLDNEPRKQSNVDENELCVGVIAQEMAKHEISKYVLRHDEESGYSINLYNYSASIHSALRHEIKQRESLSKELQIEISKREELEKVIQSLAKEIELLKGGATTKAKKTTKKVNNES